MLKQLYLIGYDFTKQMKKKNISAFASSTAFFLFLSMVPMLMVICSIIPYTPLTQENIMNLVEYVLPDMIEPLAISILSDVFEKSAGILSVAIVVTLWTAGKGVLALMRGLNSINGVEEKRNYIVVRVIAMFYTFVMLIALLISLIIMVFGNHIFEILVSIIPELHIVFAILIHLRFIFVWFVLIVLFSTIYAYIPDRKMKFKEQILGAVFSSIVWIFFSLGFSIYIGYSNSFNMYGSLSIIIIVMIWMYFCMYIILIGAYINQYLLPVNRYFAKKKEKKVLEKT